MSGDTLVTLVTRAASGAEAVALVKAATVQARYEAADLLYLDADAQVMVARVDRALWRAAVRAADGDASRLVIVSPSEVIVKNRGAGT